MQIGANSIKIVLLFFMFLTLNSCSFRKQQQTSENGNHIQPDSFQSFKSVEPLRINEVAVLTLEGADNRNILISDVEAMTIELVRSLQINTSLNVYNAHSSNKSKEVEASLADHAHGIKVRAAKLGASLGVQGVICGIINSNDSPGKLQDEGKVTSSVGFTVWLVDVPTGAVVWESTYAHSNKALTDNILNAPEVFSAKFKSKSPREMFKDGFDFVAKDLEKKRSKAFVNR